MTEDHKILTSKSHLWLQACKNWFDRQGNKRLTTFCAGLVVYILGLALLTQARTQVGILEGIVALCIVTFIVA